MFIPPTRWDPWFADAHPWGAPLAAAARCFQGYTDWPAVADYNLALTRRELCTASGLPVRFVTQPPTPRGRRRVPAGLDALYDGRIYTTGEVPTRARSWHDWLNALVWATFTRAKAALNARQYAAHKARLGEVFTTLPGARTREQDALAMVDEGALLLVTTVSVTARVQSAVDTGDVETLAGLCREGAVAPLAYGHALVEHLVAGDTSARALGVVLSLPAGDALPTEVVARCTMADRALAAALEDPVRFSTVGRSRAVPLGAIPWGT